MDHLPVDNLNPNSIQCRNKASSAIDFAKGRSRDDMLYSQTGFHKNAEMDLKRDERIKRVEERKRNRSIYRGSLNLLNYEMRQSEIRRHKSQMSK